MKNLLLGNGLNLANNNKFLDSQEIHNRFIENLREYWNLINKLLAIDNTDCEQLIQQLEFKNGGIEKETGKIFDYIHDEVISTREFTANDEYRLIEILGEIAIKSIFFENNKFLIPKISDEYIEKIYQYDNIFSLNYIEDWDNKKIVKYLHGNLKKYISGNSNIGSKLLNNNKNYTIFKKEKYEKIDFKDIIFMPTNNFTDKYDYINEGLTLNDGLRLDNDVVLSDGRDIYKDLDILEELDVFGVSPDGDEALIKRIRNVKKLKIYVYKLEENKNEKRKWESFGINADFPDSEDFLKS